MSSRDPTTDEPAPTLAVDVPTDRAPAAPWESPGTADATVDLQTGAGTGSRLQRAGREEAAAGLRIGPYEVVREIGRGGMGAVYLAERADRQFRQQVAIKLLRPGDDAGGVVRRFQAERQILANLEHPHIAHLLDGGETSDGHPYLVMEYIEGEALARWCDAHRLDTAARVEMFVKVASAVHFAHQRLVVHRDIKPGNVIVAADGAPKLLDFGIAKLLDPGAMGVQDGELTQADERLMTPAYASPEQVLGRPVSTATDVYALGVLLFELLTGRLPYAFEDFSMGEIVRVVGAQEPDRPSAAVRRREEVRDARGVVSVYEPREAAAVRDGSPERLSRRLRGDLDAIVLRALRKEPERRYASAQALIEDLQRWRDGRPVLAHADSLAYRLGKFARRHRAGLAAAVLVILSLAGGVAATVRQARIARLERDRAERRFEEVRSLARAVVFELHDAIADLPGSTGARQVLVTRALRYLDGLAREAAGDPGLQRELAEAYQRIGDVQGRPSTPNLGDTTGALASYRKAVGIRQAVVDATGEAGDRRGLSETLARLGEVQAVAGDANAALVSQRRAVALLEEAAAAAPLDGAGRRQLATLHTRLGDALARAGQVSGTLVSRRRAVALLDALWQGGERDDELLRLRAQAWQKLGNNLGNPSFSNAGDTQGALDALTRAFSMMTELRARGQGVPSAQVTRLLAVNRSNLSDVLLARDDPDGALARAREGLALFQELADLDPQNAQARLDVSISHQKIGELLERAGRWDEAFASFTLALAIVERAAREDPGNAGPRRDIALMQLRRGFVRVATGDAERGLAEMRRGHALAEELAAADPGNAEARYIAAYAAWNTGDGWARAAEEGPEALRSGRWRHAADLYRAALGILEALEREGALSGSDVAEKDRAREKLAKAEAALAGSAPSR